MKLIVNGEQVWHPMIKAAEIALTLQRSGSVVIDLDGEAPSLAETPIHELFKYLQTQGLDISKIHVLTGNPLETYSDVPITFVPESFYEFQIFQKNCGQIPTHKNIKYHFGNFISRTTMPRLILASHLYCNYKDKTFQTFHYQHNSDYHKTHLELDKLVHEFGPCSAEFDEAVLLLKSAPLLKENIGSYPILHVLPETVISPCQWYPNFFLDVICETWTNDTGFYVTEKFWRSVATKTPFIMYGPRDVLTNLKKLGFKTFDGFWDEGYQEDYLFDKLAGIKSVLKEISSKPLDKIVEMHRQMQPILNHNYEVFMNFTHEDLKKIYKK
jgi:hypothetical protein